MSKVISSILNNPYLSWLQVISNWIMQGIWNADTSEKIYKISFTLIFWLLLFILFYNGLHFHIYKSVILSFFIAHTINWIVNCNLFVLIVHRIKWFKTNKPDLFNHLYAIKDRLLNTKDTDWILYSVSHGGICNGTLNQHSDIDVSLIRKPGFKNLVSSIIFYVKEKKIADFKGVPLDIFICDSPENCIERSKGQKNPIVIFDPNNKVDKYYPEKLKISIEQAQILNGEKPKKTNN